VKHFSALMNSDMPDESAQLDARGWLPKLGSYSTMKEKQFVTTERLHQKIVRNERIFEGSRVDSLGLTWRSSRRCKQPRRWARSLEGWFLNHRGPNMTRVQFDPGFRMALHHQDLATASRWQRNSMWRCR